MARSPLDYFFSRSKWQKIVLLLRERLMALSYWSGKTIGFGPVDVASERTETPLSVKTVNDSSSPQGLQHGSNNVQEHDWTFTANVSIPAEVLEQAALNYEQDVIEQPDRINTLFDYRLALVPGASIVSNGTTHVSVYDANDEYLPHYSYRKYGRGRLLGIAKKRRIATSRFLSGVTLNLFGSVENAAGNYGHWMVDGIAQLFLALKHYQLSDIDHFLVPVMKYDFQRDSLLAIGIPQHKIVEIPVLSCFGFEQLLCTSAPRDRSSCNIPGWLIDGYRTAVLPAPESPRGKRLYISRRDAGSRKFINEDEIITRLEAAGFESVEMSSYNFNEKVSLFAHADIVVGLTGAGMTNIMFCAPDTRVVELFPASYVTYFYAAMAGYLNLDYQPLIFENHSALSRMNKYYGNLSLDIALLDNVLQDVI